jgi:hypothetical protein
MRRLLGLDGEAVEYVVLLVACDLDDFADEDSVGAGDIPAPSRSATTRQGRSRRIDS